MMFYRSLIHLDTGAVCARRKTVNILQVNPAQIAACFSEEGIYG